MKESKLIELQNRVEGLINIIRNLVKEVQINTNLAQGTLTAFQLHLGEDKWNKLVKELKNKEKKLIKETKEKKLEISKEK